MDLNRLNRDADDLIRKVVSRYNQLYVPTGEISQVELDLMLDDLRKLYDTFKTIGQVNIGHQTNIHRPQVSITTQGTIAADHFASERDQATENIATPAQSAPLMTQPGPEPEFIQEAESMPETDPEPLFETEPIPLVAATEINQNTIPSPYNKEPLAEKPEPVIEPQPVPEELVNKTGKDAASQAELSAATMLADKFGAGNKSLSETIASTQPTGVMGSRLLLQPIADLSTGIGLNDKFTFISELFANNPANYEEAINRINKAVNSDEAGWILQKYHTADWDHKQESLARLKDFIKRRFI